MKKQRIKGAWITGLVIFFIALIFFPAATGTEQVLKPVWTIPVTGEGEPAVGSDDFFSYFKVGSNFGYLNTKGKFLYFGSSGDNVTLSDRGFIPYSSLNRPEQELVLYSSGGESLNRYTEKGYPLLKEDRLFLINKTASSIKELNLSGEVLWSLATAKIITSLAVSGEMVCLGFSNGLLQVMDSKGETVYKKIPGKNKLPVILGCAINDSGDKIAAVFGVEPQVLIYLEKSEEGFTEPAVFSLDTDFRREVFMSFSKSSDHLYIENKEQLLNLNIKEKTFSSIPFKGDFHSLSLSDNKMFTLINKQADNHYNLRIVYPENAVVIKEAFHGRYVFNRFVGNRLLLGLDRYLIRFDIFDM